MTHVLVKRFAIVLIFMLTASGCGRTAVVPNTAAPASPSAGTTAAASYPEELTIQSDTTFGPGPFTYTDPRTGLSDLSNYQAVLTISFDGIRDGQPQKWSKTYTMLTTKDPQARQLTIEKMDGASQLDPVFMAEMDGLTYERRGADACNGTTIQEGISLGERLEPASFLTYVIGADEAGSETVNGVAANHYTFDQRALGEEELTESIGEMWVASEGGYIVKYLLTRKGKADYFGEGIEGTLTLDYELADPTQPVTIQLPEDCPPGMVDAPLLPDASNVDSSPGLLSYQTVSSLQDGVDFYEKNLPGLGWEAEMEPVVSDDAVALAYRQGNQSLSIFLTLKDGKVTVDIALGPVEN